MGQRQQAKAAEASAEFNAKVAENEALRVQQETAEQTKRTRIANKRLLGRQRAQIGKAGVLEMGSPLELMAETAGELELGVLDSIRAGQAQREQLLNQAAITRFEGKSTATGLRRAAFGSLLETAGSMAFGAAGAKQSGMFKGTPSSTGASSYKVPHQGLSFHQQSRRMAPKYTGGQYYGTFGRKK
jgi:hypothetical protein